MDVIGRVVTLKKAGSSYKGLCPFHNEKTPSFSVDEGRQTYKCFGCGEGGDVISFVEKYYNLDFMEAREMLARALKDCGGAEYKPVALLGTQAVAGTNYCFLCRTSGIAPETGAGYALVYVYEDLRGEPEILDISGLSIGA